MERQSLLMMGLSAFGSLLAEPGTYNEALDLSAADVTVTGIEGAELTVLDGEGLGEPIATFGINNTAGTVLQGFTLRQGEGRFERTVVTSWSFTTVTETSQGGAIYLDTGASPLLTELILEDCVLPEDETSTDSSTSPPTMLKTQSYGGAIYSLGGNPTLEGVVIRYNSASTAGAFYGLSGLPAFSHVAVLGNSSGITLWTGLGATIPFDNGVLAFNEGVALQIYLADIAFDQLTVHGNSPEYAALVFDEVGGTLSNSIISGHAAEGVRYLDETTHPMVTPTLTLDHVHFHDNTTDTDDLTSGALVVGSTSSGDPLYLDVTDDDDVTNDDFGLGPGSPAVDAGTGTDADGSVGDLGAYGGSGGVW